MEALSLVMTGLQAIIQLAAAGSAVQSIAENLRASVEKMQAENRDPTPEERAALQALIDAEMAKLLAP